MPINNKLGFDRLKAARDASSPGGEQLTWREVNDVVDGFGTAEGQKPEGKFTAEARDVLSGKDVVVDGETVEGLKDRELTTWGGWVHEWRMGDVEANVWTPPSNDAIGMPSVRGLEFFASDKGLSLDASGAPPANLEQTSQVLHRAAKSIQARFTAGNTFADPPSPSRPRKASPSSSSTPWGARSSPRSRPPTPRSGSPPSATAWASRSSCSSPSTWWPCTPAARPGTRRCETSWWTSSARTSRTARS